MLIYRHKIMSKFKMEKNVVNSSFLKYDFAHDYPMFHNKYSEGGIFPKHINGIPMRYYIDEFYRLASFVNYGREFSISTILLASKGFACVVTDSGQKLICCFCSALLEILDDMDDIDDEHKRKNLNCPVINNIAHDNISIKSRCPKGGNDNFFILIQLLRTKYRTTEPRTTSVQNPASVVLDHEVISSQPSNNSASFAVVTNTSDLSDSDGTIQNTNSLYNPQSSILTNNIATGSPAVSSASPNVGNTQPNTTRNRTSRVSIEYSENSNNEPFEISNTEENVSQNGEHSNNGDDPEDMTSYERLGIITARPKRPDYAVLATRLKSFKDWPHHHHMKPNDLASAGFFFTGYSDCARCFYCGGGLRNWDLDDNVWVEHARWFSKCSFLMQEVGKNFVTVVQMMIKERDEIKYIDVMKRLQLADTNMPLKLNEREIKKDPSYLAVIDHGFNKEQVFQLALEIRRSGEPLSSDKLYEAAIMKKIPCNDSDKNLEGNSISIRNGGEVPSKEALEDQQSKNIELRQQTTCKICLDNEVSVVFLPCGHFVSCSECSCALSDCPVCRFSIKGTVRAYMS